MTVNLLLQYSDILSTKQLIKTNCPSFNITCEHIHKELTTLHDYTDDDL